MRTLFTVVLLAACLLVGELRADDLADAFSDGSLNDAARLDKYSDLIVRRGASSVPHLVALLERSPRPQAEVIWRVTRLLSKIGVASRAAVPSLLVLIHDDDAAMRQRALIALEDIGLSDEMLACGVSHLVAIIDQRPGGLQHVLALNCLRAAGTPALKLIAEAYSWEWQSHTKIALLALFSGAKDVLAPVIEEGLRSTHDSIRGSRFDLALETGVVTPTSIEEAKFASRFDSNARIRAIASAYLQKVAPR